MKKGLIFAVLALALVMTSQFHSSPAEAFNGYVMAGGGAFGSLEQTKTGDVRGYGEFAGIVPLYWDNRICARGSFADMNNSEIEVNLESYTGTIMLLARNIAGENADKINPYLFGSLSFLHSAAPDSGVEPNVWGLDGGLGLIATKWGISAYVEVGYKKMPDNRDTGRIGAGLVFDLSKAVVPKK